MGQTLTVKCIISLHLVVNIFAFLVVIRVNVGAPLVVPGSQVNLLLGGVPAVQGSAAILCELVVVIFTLLTQDAVLPKPVQKLTFLLYLDADLVVVQCVCKISEESSTGFCTYNKGLKEV